MTQRVVGRPCIGRPPCGHLAQRAWPAWLPSPGSLAPGLLEGTHVYRCIQRAALGAPFRAGGDIQTAVTKEAIVEFMKELNGIRGSIPITAKELDYNKQSLIRRYPAGFETVGGMSNQLANLVIYGLPDSYFNDYIGKINSVTLADVERAAKTYLDPSKMAIVIVGDRKVIEPGLKELGYPLMILDTDGNPVGQ